MRITAACRASATEELTCTRISHPAGADCFAVAPVGRIGPRWHSMQLVSLHTHSRRARHWRTGTLPCRSASPDALDHNDPLPDQPLQLSVQAYLLKNTGSIASRPG